MTHFRLCLFSDSMPLRYLSTQHYYPPVLAYAFVLSLSALDGGVSISSPCEIIIHRRVRLMPQMPHLSLSIWEQMPPLLTSLPVA